MYGDTTTIRALARRLRERGDEIRDLAVGLSTSARDVDWHGSAADAMRAQVQARVHALLGTARLHDDAASALDLHARAVDVVEAALADALDGPLRKLEELL